MSNEVSYEGRMRDCPSSRSALFEDGNCDSATTSSRRAHGRSNEFENEIVAMERDRITTTNYNEYSFALLKAVASNDVDEVRTLIIQDECKANTYVTQQ